jgi:formyltetrahydrofolate synthetase
MNLMGMVAIYLNSAQIDMNYTGIIAFRQFTLGPRVHKKGGEVDGNHLE